MRPREFWRQALERLTRGERVFLALVADHTKHSPGKRGAKLLLTEAGEQVGTIGGGVMEQRVLEAGQLLLASRDRAAPVAQTLYHRRQAPGAQSGLICAGQQTNVYGVLEPTRHILALTLIMTRLDVDEAGVLVWTHDGELELEHGSPSPEQAPVRLVGEPDGQWRYEEQLLNLNRVVIFGAGHCGLALSQQLNLLGFTVTIIDEREQLPTLDQNVWANTRLVGDEFSVLAGRVRHAELSWAVIMTADFPSDTRALVGALSLPFVFVGVMGAPAKLRAIREALTERGVSDDALARIVSPVGLPISSASPAEIAVSVAAQILALRPDRFLGMRPTPFRAAEAP